MPPLRQTSVTFRRAPRRRQGLLRHLRQLRRDLAFRARGGAPHDALAGRRAHQRRVPAALLRCHGVVRLTAHERLVAAAAWWADLPPARWHAVESLSRWF